MGFVTELVTKFILRIPFHLFTMAGHALLHIFTESVIESQFPSVCLSVCVWQFKTPISRCPKDFWSKGVLLILACNDTILFFSSFSMILWFFFLILGFLSHPTVSQPTVDNGGVSSGTVCGLGCWR